MEIFVSNLPYSTTTDQVTELFAQFGEVLSARLICDGAGQSRGFGFVEMLDRDGMLAVQMLQGAAFGGRRLTARQANERRQQAVENKR